MHLSSKKVDIIVISAFFLASVLPSIVFSLFPPLVLNIFWFIIPALYLAIRERKNFSKILTATLFIGLLAFDLDIFFLHNGAWEPYISSFSFTIFGAPLEEMLWFFFHIFYILIFYEHFIDDENQFCISRKLKYLIGISTGFFLLVLLFIYAFPNFSRIGYSYLTIGSVAMIPILGYIILKRVQLLRKVVPLGIFFFIFAFIMEIQALRFGFWSFSDVQNYLYLVTIFGATFPLEEIVFWMVLGPSAVTAYYEIFADDGK